MSQRAGDDRVRPRCALPADRADYSSGDYYHCTYDAVGNRLTQDRYLGGQLTSDTYAYDVANRLTNVNGVDYTWDNNGNLLNDGVNTYTYDAANRLASFTNPSLNVTFAYNGLGDRLQQTVNGQATNYALDLNTGLTQVLDDGTSTYTRCGSRRAKAGQRLRLLPGRCPGQRAPADG